MFNIQSPSRVYERVGEQFIADLQHRLSRDLMLPEAVLYPHEEIDDFDVIEMTYYEDENTVYDDCGFPVFNLFDYITPGQYHLFKKDRLDIVVPSQINGLWIALTYMKKGEPIYD